MKACKALLLGSALVIATFSNAASAADYTLRLGSVLAPADPLQVAAEGFKQSVEERSQGAIEVQLYPSSQLGDTQDMMDQAAAGANVGTFVEASRVSVFVPEFNVLVAPYAFESVDELARFVESDTFAKWNDELREKSGLTLLSFNWYQGARHMLTKKPIATPADLSDFVLDAYRQAVANKYGFYSFGDAMLLLPE
jgi:TRAP-type C4-dicarboxylate transport system substrate-binding protein